MSQPGQPARAQLGTALNALQSYIRLEPDATDRATGEGLVKQVSALLAKDRADDKPTTSNELTAGKAFVNRFGKPGPIAQRLAQVK